MNRSHPRFHTRTLLVPYLQNFSRAGRFVPNEAHRSGYRSSRDAFNYMTKSLSLNWAEFRPVSQMNWTDIGSD